MLTPDLVGETTTADALAGRQTRPHRDLARLTAARFEACFRTGRTGGRGVGCLSVQRRQELRSGSDPREADMTDPAVLERLALDARSER